MLKRIDLNLQRTDLSFEMAKAAAIKAASLEEREPTLISWYDHRKSTHSPSYLNGKDSDFIVRDYADKWGGELEVDVNDDYLFIFLDSSKYEKHDSSPYRNIEDPNGNWQLCFADKKGASGKTAQQECSQLDDTSRGG